MLLPRWRERLLERVAFLYLVENRAQSEIGKDEDVRRLYHAKRSEARQEVPPTVSQTTVNRLVHEARELGVAGVSVDWSFAVTLKEDQALSAELADAFGLDECVVLYDSAVEAVGPGNSGDASAQPSEVGDEHRLILGLANVTAGDVKSTWSAGDHIACGGGQTICWFARAVRRNPPRKRDLIFTPLAGRLWVEDWRTGDADIMERPLDADDAVHILSEAFETQKGGRFSQINQPLYMASAPDADVILKKHCPFGRNGSWNWKLPPATRAYVGVGSLDSDNHRLAKFLKRFEHRDKNAKQSYLHVAGNALVKIRKECSSSGLPLPGDVGNRLFPTLPLPWEIKDKTERASLNGRIGRISDLVQGLNERAVIMSWQHLRSTRSVRVIAGGTSKRRALWTVLLAASLDRPTPRSRGGSRTAPFVNELTTDRETAKVLLPAIRALKNDVHLLRLYHDICCRIGLS